MKNHDGLGVITTTASVSKKINYQLYFRKHLVAT